ncbi:unnamed protein product [Notodromas monacha]|uniref:Uncharacterized protein n=1 Tax=Notodromas monacha TaxID=399045 RepID=A0A7R9BRT1_9CRUS|nr:unnamed protein product [Notodromas monacha]CAG0919607.1 unnamed protein product [Notodromas monacha]
MPVMETCWSPWLHYTDIKEASKAVAAYTLAISVIGIVYSVYVMLGGVSSEFFGPLFETDTRNTAKYAGGFLIIFCLIYIGFSILMMFGIAREVRGFILPWMIQTVLSCMSITAFGLWVLCSYYTNLWSVFAFIVIMLCSALHIYCYLCVYSFYREVKKFQKPNIVPLWDEEFDY